MREITLEDLNAAARSGGAGSLAVRIELEPAAGPDGIVAPAKYVDPRGNATYVYEKRYVGEPEARKVVLIDSSTSFKNRVEETITEAQRPGAGLLATMPRVTVEYGDNAEKKVFYDSQLPHRGFDGHIRVGSHNGEPMSKIQEYADARNSTLENLLPMFEFSPETVLFGGWDSTRSKNQLRIPSVLTGEMYGVLAEQNDDPVVHRAGARIDPVGASVKVSEKTDREKIVADSIDLSENTKEKFVKGGKGSVIGLGAIPPNASRDVLDGVSVRRIVSSRVLSFTMLRTFHFGKGAEGDAAIRTLIAAALLRAMAGYDENPVVRANCALTETSKPSVVLNKRYGEKEEIEPLTVQATEKLLEEAYKQAQEKAGIVWNGQEFLVQGNPVVLDNTSAEDEE